MSTLTFSAHDKGPLCAVPGCDRPWGVTVTTGAKQQRVCYAHLRRAMHVPEAIPKEVTP
jgi:hypothetical protein